MESVKVVNNKPKIFGLKIKLFNSNNLTNSRTHVFCQKNHNGDFTYVVAPDTFIGLRNGEVEIFSPLRSFSGFPNYHYSSGFISTKKLNRVIAAL